MDPNYKIAFIIGARPNFMKAAIIHETIKDVYKTLVIHTGQHYDKTMSDIFLKQLDFKYDILLELDRNKTQSIAGILQNKLYGEENQEYLRNKQRAIEDLVNIDGNELGLIGEIRDKLILEFKQHKVSSVFVFGDITSTLAGAVAAVKSGLLITHIESGLRSFDLTMPEEVNRILVDAMTECFFVTEKSGRDNLLREGYDDENIFLIENPMIKCLKKFIDCALKTNICEKLDLTKKSYVLLTLHRPGNVDSHEKLTEIVEDINKLAEKEKIVFPVHPRTKTKLLEMHINKKILITEPFGYLEFLCLQYNAKYIITDSGGIQEEACYMKIPCYTLRPNTERPSTLVKNGGTNILIDKIKNF